MKIALKIIFILTFIFPFFNGVGQNGDINLLKKINGSYTTSGGKFFIPVPELNLITKEDEDFEIRTVL